MFGLEDQKKKKKAGEFEFELEKDLANPKGQLEYKKLISERIQDIKKVLRSGSNKEEFDRFGVLLHGFTSLQKVMSRISTKKS